MPRIGDSHTADRPRGRRTAALRPRTAASLPSNRRVARSPADGRGTSSTGRGAVVHTVHARAIHRSGGPLHAQAVVHTGHARAGRRSGGHGSHRPSFTQTFVHTGHAPTKAVVPADHCPRGPSFSEATHSPGRRSGGLRSRRPSFTRTSARRGPPPGGAPLARTIVHTAAVRTGRHTFGPPRAETAVLRDLLVQPTAHTGRCFHSPPCSRAAGHAGGRPGRRVARTTRRSDTVSRTAPRPNAVAHASRRPGRRSGGPSLARATVPTDPHQNRPPSDSRSSLGPRLTQTRHTDPSRSPVTQTRHAALQTAPHQRGPPLRRPSLAQPPVRTDGPPLAQAGVRPVLAWVVVLAGP